MDPRCAKAHNVNARVCRYRKDRKAPLNCLCPAFRGLSFVSEDMRNVAAAKSNMGFILANPDSLLLLSCRQQRRAFTFKPIA